MTLKTTQQLKKVDDDNIAAIKQNERAIESQRAKQQLEFEKAQMVAKITTLEIVQKKQEQDNWYQAEEQRQKSHAQAINLKNHEQQLKHKQFMSSLKKVMALLFIAFLTGVMLLVLFWLYRWAFETPLIKEIETRVEVPVERIIEKPVEIPVDVMPEECTQIRRNGKIFMNCDGVKINGVPTIKDSGVKQPPELLPD